MILETNTHTQTRTHAIGTMVRNWADQSSDDEEDARERHAMLDADMEALEQQPHPPVNEEDDHGEEAIQEQEAVPRERVFDYPTDPPYTAFIGNVAYDIVDPAELSATITEMAKEVLGLDLVITDTRIMIDRRENPPKHRGFGYITVETLDQLKGLMDLNDRDLKLANRNIQLKVAHKRDGQSREGPGGQNRRRDQDRRGDSWGGKWDRGQGQSSGQGGDAPVVDGSKFRGGRYNNRQSNDHPEAPAAVTSPSTGTRPTLKLQPRTKPVDATKDSLPVAQSNIFGGAKPRDESTWQKRQQGEGGRGPRERGGAGRGKSEGRGGRDGRGGRGRDAEERKAASTDKPKREAKVAPPRAEPKPAQPEPEKKNAVTNKFAALGFDSDSD